MPTAATASALLLKKAPQHQAFGRCRGYAADRERVLSTHSLRSLEVGGALEEDREAKRPADVVLKKLKRALEEFGTYIDNNASGIVHYGERHRCGERMSTGFADP